MKSGKYVYNSICFILLLSNIMSQKDAITVQEVDALVWKLLWLHSQDVKVEIKEFLDLLKHSLSLNTIEKKRVVDAVPTLSQFQFDELRKVFVEEREKFKELAKEHPEDIKKLVAKQQAEWLQLWDLYKAEEKNKATQQKDEKKIDDIKANLWL